MSQQRAATPAILPPTPTASVRSTSSIDAASPVSSAASDLAAFLDDLLSAQCALIAAPLGIIVLAGSSTRKPGIAAVFPSVAARPQTLSSSSRANQPGTPPAPDAATLPILERHARALFDQPDSPGAITPVAIGSPTGVYHSGHSHHVITCPLRAGDQLQAVTACLVPLRSTLSAQDALLQLQLTAPRFEAYIWREQCFNEAHAKTRLRETLELLDAAQQGADAPTTGSLFCHEIQRRFACTRVSIGLVKRDRIHLAAISSSESLDRRGAAAESIESAMDECLDQDIEVIFPPPPSLESDPSQRRVSRAHEVLSTRHGPSAIVTLPLRVQGDAIGAICLERPPSDPFPPGAIPLLRLVAEFVGPAVWTRRLADRGILAVTRDRAAELARALVGPRHTAAKAISLGLLLVLLLAALVPLPRRVAADAETRALVSRTIAPPFSGYLDTVLVKPGDAVTLNQPLAALNVADLQLELAQARSEIEKIRTQADAARLERRIPDAQIAAAAMEEAHAKVALLQDRISRASITSPIDGRVARGDIEALAGAFVEPTQPLFEIIAPEPLIVTLDVDERDIARVHLDQIGHLTLASLPSSSLPIKVVRIRPSSEPVRGANVYKVEAQLIDPPDWTKPGMTGAARLDAGTTTLLARILDPVVDSLRMKLWW